LVRETSLPEYFVSHIGSMGGLEAADLVALKGGWHGSRTRIEVLVLVGGVDLFAFLYFAQIVAWIIQKATPTLLWGR
jgi:hypothetical protein